MSSFASDVPANHSTLVLLARGCFEDESAWLDRQDCPRPEFVALASDLSAEIGSYTSFRARRGWLFRALFDRFPIAGAAVGAFLARKRFDSIYCVNEETALLVAPLLRASGWQGKLVTSLHTIGRKKQAWLRLLGHARIDRVIVVCSLHKSILTERCGVPAPKVEFHPYWVDAEFFHPSRSDRSSRPGYIMACGRENRDYPTLVAAARSLPERFVVLGHGYFGGRDLRPDDCPANVEFLPRVPYPELAAAYSNASLVVTPVNDVDYAAGLTGLLEAMASGKAVVVTRSRGLASYLDAHNPGAIVPPGDPTALADAIRRLMSSADLRDQLGKANRAWVEANATIEIFARRAACLIGDTRS